MRAIKVVHEGKGASSIRLDPEIVRMAKIAAIDRGITVSEIVEEALRGYLANLLQVLLIHVDVIGFSSIGRNYLQCVNMLIT